MTLDDFALCLAFAVLCVSVFVLLRIWGVV